MSILLDPQGGLGQERRKERMYFVAKALVLSILLGFERRYIREIPVQDIQEFQLC